MTPPLRRTLLLAAFAALTAEPRAAHADPVGDLHAACARGDVEAVKRLLAADPKLVDQRTPGGITPLGRAVVHGKADVAKALLEAGANPNLAKPDGATPLHDAVGQKDVSLVRLLLGHKADTEVRWKDGATPLLVAVYAGSPEVVRLLLAAGAKRDARADDGRTPPLVAVALLAGADPKAPREGAEALLETMPVSLQAAGTPLRDAMRQVLAAAGIRSEVDARLTAPVTATLKGGLDTALGLLLRIARREGQSVLVTLSEGVIKVAGAGADAGASVVAAAPAETWPVLTGSPRYRFTRTIPRPVLEAYLARAVTHFGLLSSSPEPATPYFPDDLRMLTDIGAKFVGRCAYAWEPPDDDEAHFRLAAERAARVHAADPEMLLQAAIFETVYRKLERIPVPDWVFIEFGLPVEKRTFRYEAMLYDGGKLRDHWMRDASVPDMSKPETRLWFYYRARRYIDAGCEAIHFGQVHLMDQNDPGHRFWGEMLGRVRRYAASNARRRLLLCDAHTHGVAATGGRLLFDIHSWPLRPAEAPGDDRRMPGEMRPEFGDSIIRHSRGGRTPSGWECASLPYTVEFDNYGLNGAPGRRGAPLPWLWGYDEISWFAHLSPEDRNAFLRYAHDWLRRQDPNGFLQMPTRRVLAAPVDGNGMYHANRKSAACPVGFGQEDAIKALFSGR